MTDNNKSKVRCVKGCKFIIDFTGQKLKHHDKSCPILLEQWKRNLREAKSRLRLCENQVRFLTT